MSRARKRVSYSRTIGKVTRNSLTAIALQNNALEHQQKMFRAVVSTEIRTDLRPSSLCRLASLFSVRKTSYRQHQPSVLETVFECDGAFGRETSSIDPSCNEHSFVNALGRFDLFYWFARSLSEHINIR